MKRLLLVVLLLCPLTTLAAPPKNAPVAREAKQEHKPNERAPWENIPAGGNGTGMEIHFTRVADEIENKETWLVDVASKSKFFQQGKGTFALWEPTVKSFYDFALRRAKLVNWSGCAVVRVVVTFPDGWKLTMEGSRAEKTLDKPGYFTDEIKPSTPAPAVAPDADKERLAADLENARNDNKEVLADLAKAKEEIDGLQKLAKELTRQADAANEGHKRLLEASETQRKYIDRLSAALKKLGATDQQIIAIMAKEKPAE